MPDVAPFLNELAVAVQKHAMYPTGHPALRTVSSDLSLRLRDALADRPTLTVGVTEKRLVVSGIETKPGRALLDTLAMRLHDHQIAALHFSRGAAPEELSGLLRELALDADRRGRPIGLEPAAKLPAWPHIRIEPVEYEALRLGDEEPEGEELRAGDEPPAPIEPEAPQEAQEAHEIATALAEVELSRELLELAAEVDVTDTDPAAAVRLSAMINGISPEELKKLLDSRDAAFAAKMIRRSTDRLTPRAVIELMQAASDTETRPIGPWLVRLLTKLAHYADTAPDRARSPSDEALREIVHELVGEWELDDPRPAAYQSILGDMARETATGGDDADRPYLADRLVMMGLELDMMGSMVTLALRDLSATDLAELLGLLDAGPQKSRVAQVMWRQIATRETLMRALAQEEPDFETVDRLVVRIGLGAAEPLLDSLQQARSPGMRHQLVDRLSALGPIVAGSVVARLDADRPEATADLLSILRRLNVYPAGFTVVPFFTHADTEVRAHAYRLAVRHERDLEPAIRASLAESEPRLLAIGLGAAEQSCPPSVEPLLRRHAMNRGLPVQLRVKAVRALSNCRTESALDALVKSATQRRWILLRRLAPPNPVVLEALVCLRDEYRHLPRARGVLEQALSSEDREIRDAVGTRTE